MKNEDDDVRATMVMLSVDVKAQLKAADDPMMRLRLTRALLSITQAIANHDTATRREARLQSRQDVKLTTVGPEASVVDDLRTRREKRVARERVKRGA